MELKVAFSVVMRLSSFSWYFLGTMYFLERIHYFWFKLQLFCIFSKKYKMSNFLPSFLSGKRNILPHFAKIATAFPTTK